MAMPAMSGKDVYVELKKINPDVRVLLASGFKQDGRVQETLTPGVRIHSETVLHYRTLEKNQGTVSIKQVHRPKENNIPYTT